MFHLLKVAQATTGLLLAGGKGSMGTAVPKQPALPIKLFEMEGCPYCRRVRQVLTMLNLDVEIYPCPKNGKRFRPVAKALSGKMQFPMLVDENTDTTLLESQSIVDYLFKQYGTSGKTPTSWQHLPAHVSLKEQLVSAVRGTRGLKADKGNSKRKAPEKMLELWSFEGSPFSRLVRERLCELEIPYRLRNVAKERWQDLGMAVMRVKPGKYVPVVGGKRERLLQEVHKIQVPYLVDDNTGIKMHESADILRYLEKSYNVKG